VREQERQWLNRKLGHALGPVQDELDHFERCPACGQMIDCRWLSDVLHHDEPGHAPLVMN